MFHVVCAFSREQNKSRFLDHWRPQGVILHPLVEEKPGFEAESNYQYRHTFLDEEWIKVFRYSRPENLKTMGTEICHYALNTFFEKYHIVDEDYYFCVGDDDSSEDDFIKKLAGIDANVIIPSIKRGQHRAQSGHDVSTLVASPDNMKMGKITGSQLIMKGRIAKTTRLKLHVCGDGWLAEELWAKYPHSSFTFVPEVYQWFNWLEPCRWEKPSDSVRLLDDVTLISVDCVDLGRTIPIFEKCLRRVPFKHRVLLSHLKADRAYVRPIPQLRSNLDYSNFCIKEMYKYFNTSHCLIVQYDGWLANPGAWQDSWLNYDYIGCLTCWGEPGEDGKGGNGGFSLRSRKLLQRAATVIPVIERDDYLGWSEDCKLSIEYRRQLENEGFRFAPNSVQKIFGVENTTEKPLEWAGQFGHHRAGNAP